MESMSKPERIRLKSSESYKLNSQQIHRHASSASSSQWDEKMNTSELGISRVMATLKLE